MHTHFTPWSSKERKKKNQSAIPLAIPFTGIATISTGRGCQLERKWCALTSIIQNLTSSLCFSSPPLFLCLSLLSFQRQATHRPHCTHEAAAEHYRLPDTGQQKPKPYGYTGRGQSSIISHTDTQPSIAGFTQAQTICFFSFVYYLQHRSDLLKTL